MEPCKNNLNFYGFEGKINTCRCESCTKNKSLLMYLLHLKNLFKIALSLEKTHYYDKIRYLYNVHESTIKNFSLSYIALQEVARNIN